MVSLYMGNSSNTIPYAENIKIPLKLLNNYFRVRYQSNGLLKVLDLKAISYNYVGTPMSAGICH